MWREKLAGVRLSSHGRLRFRRGEYRIDTVLNVASGPLISQRSRNRDRECFAASDAGHYLRQARGSKDLFGRYFLYRADEPIWRRSARRHGPTHSIREPEEPVSIRDPARLHQPTKQMHQSFAYLASYARDTEEARGAAEC